MGFFVETREILLSWKMETEYYEVSFFLFFSYAHSHLQVWSLILWTGTNNTKHEECELVRINPKMAIAPKISYLIYLIISHLLSRRSREFS